jgi:fatty acid desaturase
MFTEELRQPTSSPQLDNFDDLTFDRLDAGIRRGLRKLCTLDNRHGPLALAGEYLLVAVCVVLCVRVSYWFYPVALLLIGSTQRFLAHFLHEASHKTFMRNPFLNFVSGSFLAGYLVFQLYGPYRSTHVGLHHRHLGEADADPDYMFHIECGLYDERRSTRSFLLREIVFALVGARSFAYLSYLVRDRFWSDGENLTVSTPIPVRAERALLALQWLLIAGVCAWTGTLTELALFWLIPLCTSNVAIGWIAEVAEHYPLPESENKRMLLTRNRHGRWWEQFLLSRHNDRYHLVHHLNAGIPFWNLGRAHRLLLGDPGYALWDGIWAGVFTRPPARRDRDTVISYATKYRAWRQLGGQSGAGELSYAQLAMIVANGGSPVLQHVTRTDHDAIRKVTP